MILIAVGSAIAAGSQFDTSYDGQWYQQTAVVELARGWNPLSSALPTDVTLNNFFANHYPKGPWITAASIYRLTGAIETAKAGNLALMAASAFAALSALATVRLRPAHAVLLAIAASLNPVSICQAFTFYVDGQVASLLSVLLAVGVLVVTRGGRLPLLLLSGTVIALVNTKFTALAYAGGAALIMVPVFWRLQGFGVARRTGLVLAASLLVAVFFVGFNPYVKNLIENGHPFYPVMGKGAIDVITPQATPRFLRTNRFVQLAWATFSASANEQWSDPRLKAPFTFHRGEAAVFSDTAVRTGGFGPLFGSMIVIAALLLGFALLAMAPRRFITAAVVVGILASALVNPAAWWARYAPQLWLLPLALVAITGTTRSRLGTALNAVMLVLATLNVEIVSVASLGPVSAKTKAIRAQLAGLSARARSGPLAVSEGSFHAVETRLDEAGIDYSLTVALACDHPVELVGSRAKYCE